MQIPADKHAWRLRALSVALCATVALASALPATGALAADTSVTVNVDDSQQFQKIDGFGVNANAQLWNGGELTTAIDELVANGATLWRVDIDGNSDWEAQNDDADPNTFNWTYYDRLYTTPRFQNLWSTLKYLNQKQVTIELSASGVLPAWMGGGSLQAQDEDEFVETIASVAVYARTVEGIDLHLLSPLNETNFGPPEGPKMDSTQLARVFHKLVVKLDALGLRDVDLVGPHTTSFDQEYTAALMADPLVMAHMHQFAYHSYFPCCADYSYGFIKASAYPDRHLWLGEWSQIATDGSLDGGQQVRDEWVFAREVTDELLNHLDGGASAALLWDAWDNWHEHTPCCAVDHWGAVAKDATGAYVPKKRLFTNAQVFKFVTPGSTRIAAASSDSGVVVQAFANPTTGQLTIVGHNTGSSSVTIQGHLTSDFSSANLALYQTTATADLARGDDTPVSAGSFTTQIQPDAFFTLTGAATPAGAASAPTSTATPTAAPSAQPSATATSTATAIATSTATTATPTATATLAASTTDVVLGSNVIAPLGDSDAPGEAEAFRYQATSTASITRLALYLDPSNTAKQVVVGIYSDASGQPGTLLAQSTLANPKAGQWNLVDVAPVQVNSSGAYWLALLAPNGGNPVSFRDVPNGGAAQTSASKNLSSLPTRWSAGDIWASSPAAFYAVASGSSASVVTSTPSPSPTTTPSPSPTASHTPTPTATPSPTSTALTIPTPLVGTTAISSSIDSNLPGQPEAFPYTAASSGVATSAWVYVDPTNTAGSLVLGVYADNSGAPGALLAQTTLASSVPGAWNSAPIGPIQIVAGSQYWLALMQPHDSAGKLAFRVQQRAGGSSQTGTQVNTAGLPVTWAGAGYWSTTALSAYLAATP